MFANNCNELPLGTFTVINWREEDNNFGKNLVIFELKEFPDEEYRATSALGKTLMTLTPPVKITKTGHSEFRNHLYSTFSVEGQPDQIEPDYLTKLKPHTRYQIEEMKTVKKYGRDIIVFRVVGYEKWLQASDSMSNAIRNYGTVSAFKIVGKPFKVSSRNGKYYYDQNIEVL